MTISRSDSPVTFRGLHLAVSYTYEPETPGVWTFRNGDPGLPGDPAEIEISSIRLSGSSVNLLEHLSNSFIIVLEDRLIELEQQQEKH